ncbi:hypothetical protein [Sphingomonas sp. Root241]|uniref:hypothetical protein n=1 Tax=Sphingomonas sp. Root241 TaxID=1736501 RepID=UPI0006FC6A70|nr:hypothetical protein [Sphingomonas sp. Root241]KRC79958.1 hypothetical protein ASE13_12985 [Sphingomonas sp. Root241]
MPAYIVGYDLDQPNQQYDCLKKKLEAYGTQWRFQQSVWLIDTSDSAATIRDNLKSCLDSGDKLFVGRLAGEAAWQGYSDKGNSWLTKLLTAGFG